MAGGLYARASKRASRPERARQSARCRGKEIIMSGPTAPIPERRDGSKPVGEADGGAPAPTDTSRPADRAPEEDDDPQFACNGE